MRTFNAVFNKDVVLYPVSFPSSKDATRWVTSNNKNCSGNEEDSEKYAS